MSRRYRSVQDTAESVKELGTDGEERPAPGKCGSQRPAPAGGGHSRLRACEPCSTGVSKRANGPRPSCPSLKGGQGCFFPSWRLGMLFWLFRRRPDAFRPGSGAKPVLSPSWQYVFEPFGWPLNLVLLTFQSEQMGHDMPQPSCPSRSLPSFTAMLLKAKGAFPELVVRFWAFWLAFEPCSIGASKRANWPRPSCPSRSFPRYWA